MRLLRPAHLALLVLAGCGSPGGDTKPGPAPNEKPEVHQADPAPAEKAPTAEQAPDRAKFVKGLELVTTEAGFVEAVETFDTACDEVTDDDPDPVVTGFCRTHKSFRKANTAAQEDPSKAVELRVATKVWKESLDLLSVSLTKKPLESPDGDGTPCL